ncbi:MAG: hypothetical protein AABY15_05465 [Nanoarchaeota archaeon]
MNAETFTYWLQGALELNPEMLEKGMTPEQVKTIQDHLNLVFKKVTPDRFKKTESEIKVIKSEEIELPPFPQYPNNDGRYCTPSAGYTSPSTDVPQAVAIC